MTIITAKTGHAGKICLNISASIAGLNPRARVAFAVLVPLLVYCALSFAYFGNTRSWTHNYFGYTTDPISFVWFLNWWPFAIIHHLNPFICKYVWFPDGFNFTWATAIPTLSLLSWPITALGGPVLSFNVLSLAAPAFGAWGAFLLAREVSRNWAAALVGGYLFGFSTPEYSELLSELNLDTVVLIPLAVLLCVRRARGSLGQKSFVVLLTLLLAAQIGISTESLMTLCLMGALAWMVFLFFAPAEDRLGLLVLARDIGISAPFVVLLVSPFLYYLIIGLPDVPKIINSPVIASSDLINFLIPGSSTHFGWPTIFSIAREFYGFRPDNGTYIGLPLFLVLILCFSRRISLPYVRALLVTACLIAIFSLGPLLHFNGRITGIHMPWALALHLPIARDILPARLINYVMLCTALTATLWLAEKSSITGKIFRYVLAGLACWILVPFKPVDLSPPWVPTQFLTQEHYFSWSPWPKQPFFTPQNVRTELGPDPTVLLLPAATWADPGMAWQLDAGMQFTQVAAYVGFTPVREQGNGILDDLTSGTVEASFANDITAYCDINRIKFILIGPGTPPSLVTAIDALKWPEKIDEGVEIVRVPDPSKLKFLFTRGDYWPSPAPLNWMGKQLIITSRGIPAKITLTGKYRPTQKPVRITVARGSTRRSYEMGQSSATQTIILPAGGTVTLSASDTFVPDHIIHNGDTRELSVLVGGISPSK